MASSDQNLVRLLSRGIQSAIPSLSNVEFSKFRVDAYRIDARRVFLANDQLIITPPTIGDENNADVIPGNNFRIEFCAIMPLGLTVDASVDSRRSAMQRLYVRIDIFAPLEDTLS